MLFPSLFFAACGPKNSGGIDIPAYFEKVTYRVKGSSSADGTPAEFKDFTHNLHDNQVKYTQVSFTGKKSWLYKMTLEKISFEVYSNITEEVEIDLTVTQLKDGNPTTGSTTFTDTISVPMVANKPVKVTFYVNKLFNSSSTNPKITLDIESSYYEGDNEELNLKFDIMNFKIFAKHI